MEKQSRAKEYYSDVFIDIDMPDETIADFAPSLITMNHKTIEDVKGLLKNSPIILTKHLNLDTPKEISKWLRNFVTELEKLKI